MGMLVLSRKKNESIVIESADGPINLIVVEIRGDKVRLGFEAAPEIVILRSELIDGSLDNDIASDNVGT
jgi:carbon storage regulator